MKKNECVKPGEEFHVVTDLLKRISFIVQKIKSRENIILLNPQEYILQLNNSNILYCVDVFAVRPRASTNQHGNVEFS